MHLPEFARTTTFRWTMFASGAFALCILLMFAFLYWRVTAYMIARTDGVIASGADVIAADSPEQRLQAIDARLRQDPRRIWLAALFAGDGRRLAGNLESLPDGLQVGTEAKNFSVIRVDHFGREEQFVRAIARRLPNGDVLVIGRNVDELVQMAEIVEDALVLGLLPALGLSLAGGVFLSRRAQKRVEEVNRKVQRIVAGELRERLPTLGLNDPFDRLAVIVNGMLDEIETLIQRIAGSGDDIAHDLRTPLTRVRARLERGRDNAETLDDLRTAVDQAIGGLDQALAIITALLRITEIEQSRRLAEFGNVAMAELVREVGDLYEPIAEDKRVTFKVDADADLVVRGDRDLLFEAVANLVDNAVKFTPEGGSVELKLARVCDQVSVRVRDTGPGISTRERDLVVRRFYRSDKSRNTQGIGLGLSLVTAIVKLHGFRFIISPGPGCLVEIACPQAAG